MSPLPENSDYNGRIDSRQRRRFLLGLGTTVVLAGCLSDSRNETEDGNAEEPDDDSLSPEPATRSGDNGGLLSRAEARTLLPPESLAFRYVPPVSNSAAELWVAVVGETNATAIGAEAKSGGYNKVSPQNGTVDGYLGVPVQVDPNGDEVTVFAINDDGDRGPVTSVSVPTDTLTTEQAERAVPPEALSFTYEPPDIGDYGTLMIEITADTDADTFIARPTKAPDVFIDRIGDLSDEKQIETGSTLSVAVDPDGDEVIVWATVDGATGEVTRWQGPD